MSKRQRAIASSSSPLRRNKQFFCTYCERKLRNSQITIDHIIPRSWGVSGTHIRGETNQVWNRTVSCWDCNNKKGHIEGQIVVAVYFELEGQIFPDRSERDPEVFYNELLRRYQAAEPPFIEDAYIRLVERALPLMEEALDTWMKLKGDWTCLRVSEHSSTS